VDYDPDRAQKLISSSMSGDLSTRKISSKSMYAFFSNLANRQTEKHRGQLHIPLPLSEIKKVKNKSTQTKKESIAFGYVPGLGLLNPSLKAVIAVR